MSTRDDQTATECDMECPAARELREELTALLAELADARAEVARHHRDFDAWE